MKHILAAATLAGLILTLTISCSQTTPTPATTPVKATTPAEQLTPPPSRPQESQTADVFYGAWNGDTHSANADGTQTITTTGWMYRVGPGNTDKVLKKHGSAQAAANRLAVEPCLKLYTRRHLAAKGIREHSKIQVEPDGLTTLTLQFHTLETSSGLPITNMPDYMAKVGRGPGLHAIHTIGSILIQTGQAVAIVGCDFQEPTDTIE